MSPPKARDAVLSIGRIYCDLVFMGLPAMPRMGREVFAPSLHPTLGGGAYIAAAHLERLGRKAALVACYGTDPISRSFEERLKETGIDLRFLDRRADAGPQVTVVMSGASDRAFLSVRAGPAVPGTLDAALDWDRAALLHIAEYATLAEDPGLIARAKARGLIVSLDPSWDEALIRDPALLVKSAGVDVFLPNEDEARAITGKDDIGAALDILAGHFPLVAIKCGASGARLAAGDARLAASAPRVEVVDTTGAGDAFNSGLLDAYLAGADFEICLQAGIACGTQSVRAAGGATQVSPNLQSRAG